MKRLKIKLNLNIDWKSKIVDLLIVILGISIAFKLNTWNEATKTNELEKEYVNSFYEENISNEARLVLALEFSESNKNNIDSLKHILLSKQYSDERIKTLMASMMGVANYSPSTITMENIIASGEFELIDDVELRKELISTYNTYNTTLKLEGILTDFIDRYITPFLFENIRFSDLSSLNSEAIEDPRFENLVFGYDILLGQQIKGYQDNLERIKILNSKLTASKNTLE